MPAYKFSARSLRNLAEVHPFLAAVPRLAITDTDVDFAVIDGARSLEEQRAYVDRGVSKTLDSLHLPQLDGWAWAFDAVPYVDGRLIHTTKSPEEDAHWRRLSDAMFKAARTIGVDGMIEWGGHWSFRDLAHWQFTRGLRRRILEV